MDYFEMDSVRFLFPEMWSAFKMGCNSLSQEVDSSIVSKSGCNYESDADAKERQCAICGVFPHGFSIVEEEVHCCVIQQASGKEGQNCGIEKNG